MTENRPKTLAIKDRWQICLQMTQFTSYLLFNGIDLYSLQSVKKKENKT